VPVFPDKGIIGHRKCEERILTLKLQFSKLYLVKHKLEKQIPPLSLQG
jgi:hypothetical protein